jgi:hypothetical protein
MLFKCELSLSNHNFGARRKPYKERISFQYVPGGDLGQPIGGRTKYVSSGGRRDCTNACLISQFLTCANDKLLRRSSNKVQVETLPVRQSILYTTCDSPNYPEQQYDILLALVDYLHHI